MRKISVIIDCDPGLDDAIAIAAMAGAEDIDILGVVSVGGNQSGDVVTRNARNILDFLGKNEVPVVQGACTPLFRAPAPTTEAVGDISLPVETSPGVILGMNAIDFYEDALTTCDGKVTILAIGPLTNIATLIKASEHVLNKIEKIVVMGGANITADTKHYRTYSRTANYNFYWDAEAAAIVFDSGIPVVMVGADITYENGLCLNEINRLAQGEKGRSLAAICRAIAPTYARMGFDLCPVQDAVAAAYVINPEAFEVQQRAITVDYTGHYSYGASYVDMRINALCDKQTYWVSACDRKAMADTIVDNCLNNH